MRINEVITHKLTSNEFKTLITPAVKTIGEIFTANGYEIRIVGGAVRDLVRGIPPKDIDMATDAGPNQTMAMLKKAGIRVEPTGLAHGTVTAIIDDEPVEITTLRIDSDQDGRHAKVSFTNDWRLDAERRDLTYNSMSLGLDGTIYDYFGGIADLKAGRTRFVGDATQRIREDYLRILRYFRFVGRSTTINWEKSTLNAIAKEAPGLKRISGERIWAELSKIMIGKHAGEILYIMDTTGVLGNCDFNTNGDFAKVSQLSQNTKNPALILSVLIPTISALNMVRARWKFDTDTYNMAKFIIENRANTLTIMDALRLLVVNGVDKRLLEGLFVYQGNDKDAQSLHNWQSPQFPVNGDDLIKAGVKKGPELGSIIKKLKLDWVDSKFKLSKQDLLNSI